MVGATGFEPATPCAQDGKEEATRGSARPLPRFFLINSITWGNTRTHRAATACHPFVTRLSVVLLASKQTVLEITNNCFLSSTSVCSRCDTRISGHRSASVFPLAVDTTIAIRFCSLGAAKINFSSCDSYPRTLAGTLPTIAGCRVDAKTQQ